MHVRKLLILFSLVLLSQSVFANFDFNANCVRAYKNLLSLKLKSAREIINQEKASHPHNSITILLDNYYDYFWLLTTDDKTDFDRLKDNKSHRLDLLEDEDKNSPWYNFSIAEVNLQWALLHNRFGENTTAGFEINKAYRLLQANNKKYPSFLPDDMPTGVVNVLLGALPNGTLKSALGFFGIKGNLNSGLNMLEQLLVKLSQSDYPFYYDEVVFYLTYIQSYVINDPSAYNKMIQYTNRMDSGSLLKSYIKGFVSLRTGHSSEAIVVLEKRPEGSEYQPYPYLDYLLGCAKMNRLDNNAYNYFSKFLQEKGTSFIKDSYLHLGWNCILQNDVKRYNAFAQLVKTKGYTYNEKDKQAQNEAGNPAPDINLLKARLLFDGGYYEKALAQLQEKNADDFKQAGEKTEYYYRLGRIYEALNKDEEALNAYQSSINTGSSTAYYFAPTSALRMGNIYERQKNEAKAVKYYNMAKAFKNHQDESSIEKRANEGLKRMGY